jgi:methyl-accepting chemotaxis protein
MLGRSTSELAEAAQFLGHVREMLTRCATMLAETIETSKLIAREIPEDIEAGSVRKCWEIIGCSPEVRERCPAYRDKDWRCFLMDGVACSSAEDAGPHGQGKCYECPVLRTNLEHLVLHGTDSVK